MARSKYSIWQNKRNRTKFHIMNKNVNNLPRLVVYRSNSNIYAQLVDDALNKTIVAASSIDKDLKEIIKKTDGKVGASRVVGDALAKKIKNEKIKQVIFDRNGYKYHGRIRALAEAVRSADIII